ncbi:MAG TPA: hypothetical protein VLV87_06015 [Gammaproteobacteria bacterium]|nr:hypothetical protein [Gammaproteobacteria bacterium]
MRARLGLGLAAVIFLAACATAPKDAPGFSVDSLPQDPAYALLVVYRGLVPPLAYKSTLSVNGVEAVEMPNEAFTWIKVRPGHTSLKNDWSFAAGNPAGALDLAAQAGHRYYIEIFYPGDGSPITAVTGLATYHTPMQGRGLDTRDEATALKILHSCRYVPVEDGYVPPAPISDDVQAMGTGH